MKSENSLGDISNQNRAERDCLSQIEGRTESKMLSHSNSYSFVKWEVGILLNLDLNSISIFKPSWR